MFTWRSLENPIMYTILKMADGRGKRMKFGTCGPINCISRALFMTDSFTSVWDDSLHFAKFPMLRFSKDSFAHSFLPISTKLKFMESMVIGG